jgi:iron complex outermembrane receptor protein
MSRMRFTRARWIFAFSVVSAICVTPSSAAAQNTQPPPQVTLPPVTVTAQKEPADPQTLPVSLTPVPLDALWNGAMTTIGEASMYAPNTFFTDFTARKLSEPRFRGIGSSPANPAITTYIDGVPQLNTNSSSIELLDVGQLEFVRGPQSDLFGRNTLGGLVNITSVRPSLSKWTGSAVAPFGNFNAIDVRGDASGPLGKNAAVGFAIGHSQRDGFTKNDVTGHAVDSRDATFGKAQFLFTPTASWETRLIYTGERARDGDYALNDLGSLRANPFHTSRDFEGHTDRDLNSVTFVARHTASRFAFTSTTGFVHWKTDDLTDLDYTALPLLTRANAEKDTQFTEEARIASTPAGALKVSKTASLKWQAGVFIFTQNYDQDAVNTFSPFVLSQFIPVPVDQHSPQASLDDKGVGVYGNGTLTLRERIDLTFGARVDHEHRKADLNTFYSPQIAPPTVVNTEKGFSNVSPQAAIAYHARPDVMPYFSISGGYKAGGFNPASPAGSEAYGEEHTWNYEGGVKTAWLQHRVTFNAAVFSIDWQDLQLNLPNPAVPGQFYIANVGSARSNGFELEVNGRAHKWMEAFATFGYTDARFGTGTTSSGADVSNKQIPNTPDYTASFGAQISGDVNRSFKCYGRGEAVFYGAFKYDDQNAAGQGAYSLVNFRAGARAKLVFVEGWIRNAFDTKYIPVAFAYDPRLAPSGFIGEMGRPRTFGVTAGVSF